MRVKRHYRGVGRKSQKHVD